MSDDNGDNSRDQSQPNQPDEPVPDGWGAPVSEARQAELKALAERQREWAAQPPIAGRRGGSFKFVRLTGADVFWLAEQMRENTRLEGVASLHLEGANLSEAYLAGANLAGAHLADADLREAHLAGANFEGADLEGAIFSDAHLAGAKLSMAHLERANFAQAHLEGIILAGAHLETANLNGAHLERADFLMAHLERASLIAAHLGRAVLVEAGLERADLSGARLEDAVLHKAHLEGANLSGAHLEGADLTSSFFDKATRLNEAFFNGVRLDQVTFDNVNLTVVEWGQVQRLGDEIAAREDVIRGVRAYRYHAAARAYRALAVALRAQGLGNEATRFHYRAELMARREQFYTIFDRLFSHRFLTAPAAFFSWLFSWLLGTFAGYGDRLGRLFLTYLVVVSAFAGLMFAFAGRPPSFDSIRDVYVLSITSFHGRGIQPPGLHLNDALATLTAVEAFFGLAIEGIFIAAFTRRVTGN